MSLTSEFETLLHELEHARLVDDELHRRNAPLQERVASHERLVDLRAAIARSRAVLDAGSGSVSGSHDSRTRRGASSN